MNDGQIVWEVTADGKHVIADIQDITRQIAQESKKWDASAKEATDGMDKSFSGLLKKLSGAAIGAAVVNGLKNIVSASVEAASELQEVQNVVDVTFGDGAAKIEKWAKAAGSQFGLTETQAKRFSSTMGAMLKSSGLAGEKIVDVSTDLAGLAADMASFYNLDFDTAFQKIRSGISGQTMPLKELGIDMSVATLNAFALKQGLEKTFDQMSQGEQVMLRYQYLMQATADAQGDFARTSDGYANAMRKLETNVDNIKAKLGSVFLDTVAEAVGALNGFLETLLPDESQRTVLDEFADIDFKTESKLAEIASIKEQAETTAAVLEQIYGAGDTGKTAAGVVAEYGIESDKTAAFLSSLGLSTDEITSKNESWLETCKRLVKVIPGLNSIINTETGEVKGGKSAIDDYVNAWADGQKRIALMRAQEEKRQALANKYAELPGLEVDKMVAEERVRKAYDQLQKIADKYSIDLNWYGDNLSLAKKNGAEYSEWNKELQYYLTLVGNLETATDAYEKQNKAYQEGLRLIEEGDKVIKQYGGDAADAATESALFWEQNAENAKEAVETFGEALTTLDDYVQGVRDSVEKAVESVVSGFSKIETPAMKNRQKIKDLEKELTELDSTAKDYESDLKKINDQIAASRGEQISARSMADALKQQAEYMESYLANLRKARELGFSAEVLAALSDGSEESYDYLEQLAKATPDEVKEINAGYQSVIDKKKELTDELTGQQLTVDKTYQSMAEKAREAVAALDLEGDAATNSGKTVAGIAKGISDHVPEVQSAVDSIISQLDRLNGWGVDIDLAGFGSITFTTDSGKNADTSGRFGLDYVPRDDYIIRAHEGERLLNAQENQRYTALFNGGIAGFDMDMFGNVMRDNVKPGGDVYLDGRRVGNVISDIQGRKYKSIERAGFQK